MKITARCFLNKTKSFALMSFESLFQQGLPTWKIVVLLSILLCHSGHSEAQNLNQGEMFQTLYSSWSVILIPDQVRDDKKTFSVSPTDVAHSFLYDTAIGSNTYCNYSSGCFLIKKLAVIQRTFFSLNRNKCG